ncbi:MAG: hypothetical protein Q9219_001590 [cf. Caloplaca sp. 3 TL-2023]
MSQCSVQVLEFLINHVVLPPKLPQEAESEQLTAKAEEFLLKLVSSEVKSFRQQAEPAFHHSWLIIEKMLRSWGSIKPHGPLSATILEKTVLALEDGDVLPLKIRAQNAGIIIRQHSERTILECFELSSPSADVMRSMNSLQRTFPAHGLAMTTEITKDPKFCHELCNTLCKMDMEAVDEFMPAAYKAGSRHMEIRDTCHPRLVTEMLMASLAALGAPIEVLQVEKKIRDDVLWDDCLLPWRRSSFWLIMRVSIQTTLAQHMESGESSIHYKNFMVHLLVAILDLAQRSGTSHELCHIIKSKMARRGAKLGRAMLPSVQKRALAIANQVAQSHQSVWQDIQQLDACHVTRVSTATLEDDITLTMHRCRPALDSALQENKKDVQIAVPVSSSAHNWIKIAPSGFPMIQSDSGSGEDAIYALNEYEQWIWQSLPSWLEKALAQPSASHCTSVALSSRGYKDRAQKVYLDCPEQQSLMLLVIGETWRALDLIAGKLLPLLHQYSPELPLNLFYPLLLSKKAQMQRLLELELHINRRHSSAQVKKSCLFTEPSSTDTNCLAFKYFESSASHQTLREEIVAHATVERDMKRKEWRDATERYNNLQQRIDEMNCTTWTDFYGNEIHQSYKCEKCRVEQEMKGIVITKFEWPLPEDEVLSRLLIFELRCPEVIVAWRDLTWMLINDLGRPRSTLGAGPQDTLATYEELSEFYKPNDSRIVRATTIKSISASHYSQASLPVPVDQVLCHHAPRWKHYDESSRLWLCDQTDGASFSARCKVILSSGPYVDLQYAVNSTVHSQNEVLSTQCHCSPELSLHEHIAYGSLRADGEKTQWLNICRELNSPNLTWNSQEVCSLIRHAAWQVGTPNDTYLRISHGILESSQFHNELLLSISSVLRSVQANRQNIYTMRSLILLLLRLISLASNSQVTTSTALELLRYCRITVFAWMTELSETLRTTTSADQIRSIRRSLVQAALLCKMTFDVDAEHLPQVMSSSDDVYYWTTSAMLVHDNTPAQEYDLPTNLRLFILRDRKLSHSVLKHLQSLLTTSDNAGLDRSVMRAWSAYSYSAKEWRYHQVTKGRWIYKMTTSGVRNKSQTVYYNMLNGQLLVDGRPIGLLPKEYTSHAFFVRTFGAQILRVAAPDIPGMSFMTANEEYGYKFYFDLRATDLVIRAKNATTTFELIPHNRFDGDFPTFFVHDCIHWLDTHTREVEFRPLDKKWSTNMGNWRLYYNPKRHSFLRNDQGHLVDVRSSTCQSAISVFGALEKAEFMHVTKPFNGRFEVSLPRLGLHFFLNDDGDMECQELRKVVDHDQSLGTMIGLQSRLVLCSQGERSRSLDRIVLIPQGDISTSLKGSRLTAHVTAVGRTVSCLRYQHDAILNRLEGDGSMTSRLYQAYLHALTSYFLPDPLTGNLGSVESMRILDEQLYRCFKPLEKGEIELLDLIAGLTPRRFYYPEHLRVMQQVSWQNQLNSLAQRSDFRDLAEKIRTHAQHFDIYYPDLKPLPTLALRGDHHLLQRAKLRNSIYLNTNAGGDGNLARGDVRCEGRDTKYDSVRAARVYEIASSIAGWSGDMAIGSKNLIENWKTLGTVSGFGSNFNFSTSIHSLLKLSFSASWAPLYEYCRQATREKSQYKLLFLFSNLAFGSNLKSLDDLKILLSFATNSSMQSLPAFPNYPSFTLINGSNTDGRELRSAITPLAKTWPGAKPNASPQERRLQHEQYQRDVSADVRSAIDFFEKQWPCKVPNSAPSSYHQRLKLGEVDKAVQKLFAEWYKNRECENHLRAIRGILDTMNPISPGSVYKHLDWRQVKTLLLKHSNRPLTTFSGLMVVRSPITLTLPIPLSTTLQKKKPVSTGHLRSLVTDSIGAVSQTSDCMTRAKYKSDLLASLDAFEEYRESETPDAISPAMMEAALAHLDECLKHIFGVFNTLCEALQPVEPAEYLLKAAGLWPSLRKNNLLEVVASSSCTTASSAWKKSIVSVGEAITVLQRARRLVLSAEKNDALSFFKEIENPGRVGWTAHDRPDWLLMEIENDLLIREMQARVALEMINPSNSANNLMQMNMVISQIFQDDCANEA